MPKSSAKRETPNLPAGSLAPKEPIHYRLTHEELLDWIAEYDLKWSEAKVYLYFVTLNPFGDRDIDVSIPEVCLKLKLKKSAFYQAIGRLEELGLLDAKVLRASVRIFPLNQRIVHLNGKLSAEMENCPPEWKAFHLNGKLSAEMENRSPEQSYSPGSETPHTIHTDQINQTYSEREREEEKISGEKNHEQDHSCSSVLSPPALLQFPAPLQLSDWTNFSAPGREPEFFDFVAKRAAKFENPVPADVKCTAEAWIRKQGHILYPEYLAWREGQKRGRSPQPADPPPSLPPALAESDTRSNALARLRVKLAQPQLRQAAIAEAEEWGFVITDRGLEDLSHADGQKSVSR
jgi:hypothetical protein